MMETVLELGYGSSKSDFPYSYFFKVSLATFMFIFPYEL